MMVLFLMGIMLGGTCLGFLTAISCEYLQRIKRSNLPRHLLLTSFEVWFATILMAGIKLSVVLIWFTIPQLFQ